MIFNFYVNALYNLITLHSQVAKPKRKKKSVETLFKGQIIVKKQKIPCIKIIIIHDFLPLIVNFSNVDVLTNKLHLKLYLHIKQLIKSNNQNYTYKCIVLTNFFA